MFFKRRVIKVVDKGSDDWEELVKDMQITMRRVRELQEAVEELDDKFMRMRGLIYARKLHKPPEDEQTKDAEEKPLSREELRRQLTKSGRFIPGKPPVHIEK